jgi:two-component system, OmpR family, response regulator
MGFLALPPFRNKRWPDPEFVERDFSMRKKIALIEDDDVIRENYAELLADEGFDVIAFADRPNATAYFEQQVPDLALLDIGLDEEPEGGFHLCTDLRRLSPHLPILFLTSHNSEIDKISGFRLGADDYLTKDISIEFLIVRIDALLRRYENIKNKPEGAEHTTENQPITGNLTIDRNRLVAFWNDHPVDLTLTQFWIVQELTVDPGQAKNYSALMTAAVAIQMALSGQIYVDRGE